jgi:lipoprotein-releasing system ATP-binding protein
MASILSTKGLSKTFKIEGGEEFQALKNVNLEIESGQLVSIVGQSGSGKSTLLYVLSTLDTHYQGEITFDGKPLRQQNANQLAALRNSSIGFVFQFHYLLPEFTVQENVCLPAYRLGKYPNDKIQEIALEKLDMLGLKSQATKRASQLSGGQQQRVAIARALMNEPKVIFGDEPTGNLDSANGKMVFDIFRDLSQNMHQSIIVVTHDMDLADSTDRKITLKDGIVVS